MAPGEITVAGTTRADMDGVMASFGIELVPWSEAQEEDRYDLRVVVDASGLDQVEPCPDQFVLVDHHAEQLQRGPLALAPRAETAVHAEAPSCTWLIYERLKAERFTLTHQMALAVLCGFLGDNGLTRAHPRTIQGVGRLMDRHGLTMAEARRSMDPLVPPDPEPTLDAIRTGQTVSAGPYKLFYGSVSDVRQSYSVRLALLTFGFDGVVLRLLMNGHGAVHYDTSATHARRGVMSRLLAQLKRRFPDAGHWRSGFTRIEDLDGAARECVRLMAEELEAAL